MVDLRDTMFTINLQAGTYSDRFAVVFKFTGDEGDEIEDEEEEEDTDDTSDDSDDQNDQDDPDNQDDSDNQDDQDDDQDTDERPGDDTTGNDSPPDDRPLYSNSKLANTNVTAQYTKTNRSITVVKENDTKLINASLYAMTGQLIKQWQVRQDSERQMLPVSDISAGAYLLQLQTDQGPITKKLLIH